MFLSGSIHAPLAKNLDLFQMQMSAKHLTYSIKHVSETVQAFKMTVSFELLIVNLLLRRES